ncbi:hypothetical protein HPB50_023568 [Hyalomma asiaticum]|uniref:Uncharacterized protein n=1 Tax=Hyalomma asiaticum TaxID=266040 RepID=A0ACB7T2L9_HYAAI|nr:hypothetical protein HPB50_023568 [Hyalomma asiaticum]
MATLFEEYIHAIDNKMANKNSKVLFTVDNWPCQGKIASLEAAAVEFLTAYMRSGLQPTDQGVVDVARKIYRKSLLHRILLSYENGKGYEIDLLGAVHLLSSAWQQARAAAIANCFAHTGFYACHQFARGGDRGLHSEEPWQEVIKLTSNGAAESNKTFLEYVLCKQDVPVTGEMTDA